MNKTLNHTANGKIIICTNCNKIFLEFNNLFIKFTDDEYHAFADYVGKIDGKYWHSKNARSVFSRKIIISVNSKNINVLLSIAELNELKTLLFPKLNNNRMYFTDSYKVSLN
ncbi:MAG: hypothetical protein FD143_331 [Ignavibacteria bacterium]|nr:MAG: hypothetical protein FD143_331 [Ignavibacteria bacterium]KAF0161981.1 MAG: hypothetical protein FD188_426 [Ignavibacteria bacterium]